MRIHRHVMSRINDQSGVTAVVVAIVIPILIGITALAVDMGYVMTTKNELQNVGDAAALAAARQLGAIYQGMTYEQQQDYVSNPATIQPVAMDIAGSNRAGGENIAINAPDIVIGQWNSNTKTLTSTLSRPDAVRVTGRRDASANGPITTFFARILGIDTVDLSALATAALTGQSTAGEGDLELPIGISSYFFESDELFCDDSITFSPTNDPESCAGWTTFQLSPSNDITIRRILQEVPGYTNSDITAGETEFEFIGGDLSTPTFDALLMLYREKGYDYIPAIPPAEETYQPVEAIDGVPVTGSHPDGVPLFDDDGVTRLLYPDGTERNYHVWETSVVVYEWTDCSNPNTSIMINGFATVILTDVIGAPEKRLVGTVICNVVDAGDSRGGGGEYGTMGSIPGLVE
jgi:Flp pilus assembly protein TadG